MFILIFALVFPSCANPTNSTQLNETNIEIRKLADESLIEENGIIYNPANKYDKNYKEYFFDINGIEIKPDVETIFFNGDNKGTKYSRPYSFEMEVIRYGNGTVAKANIQNSSNDEGIVYSTVHAYSINNDYALVQIDDNIYKTDYKTSELTPFMNGEYQGYFVDKIPVYNEDGSIEDYGYDSPCHAFMEFLNADDGYLLFKKRIADDIYLCYKDLLSGEEYEIGKNYNYSSCVNNELIIKKSVYGDHYINDSTDYTIKYYKYLTDEKEMYEINKIASADSEIKLLTKRADNGFTVSVSKDELRITDVFNEIFIIHNSKIQLTQLDNALLSPNGDKIFISGINKNGDIIEWNNYLVADYDELNPLKIMQLNIEDKHIASCKYISNNVLFAYVISTGGTLTSSYIINFNGDK